MNRSLRPASGYPALGMKGRLDRPGGFYTLGQSGINVEEMENIIYKGAEAACARIQLDDLVTPNDINAIRANDNVLSAEVSLIRR